MNTMNAPARKRTAVMAALTAFFALAVGAANADFRICTYNFLNYDTSAFAERDPNLKIILSGVNPDILVAEEIVSSSAPANIRDNVLNAVGGPGQSDPYALATFTNTSAAQDIALFYRTSKFGFPGGAGSYILLPRLDSPRDVPRWRLRPVTDSSGANDIYVYGMHLDASMPANRTQQAQTVRDDANALPAGTHFVFLGDFNLDSSTEQTYDNFTGSQPDNDGRAWDPLNPSGMTQTWHNSASFASFHTQSPHENNSGSPAGGAAGGMDDRFDFILVSPSLHDGSNPDYNGNYKAFGNDGLHYNNDINDNPIIPEGLTVATALHAASDHLPVYADFTDPLSQPQISVPAFIGFPQVLVGSTVNAQITVTNPATPPGIALQYSFTPPTGFTAPAGTFNLAAGTNTMHTLTLTGTATSGNKNGILAIANNTTTNPKNVTLIGVVLDHAVPSTLPDAIDTDGAIDFGVHDAGMFSDQIATVYNATVPQFPNKVNLSIESGAIINDMAGRFSLVGFNPPIAGISASTNLTVHFDDVGAAPGNYTATLLLMTRDDTPAVGGTALANITFDLTAEIPNNGPIRGDFDLNLAVGPEDIDPFVTVLLDPDSASVDERWIADMNEDTMVDALDLQPFVDAILN